jgi:hypothetical protein
MLLSRKQNVALKLTLLYTINPWTSIRGPTQIQNFTSELCIVYLQLPTFYRIVTCSNDYRWGFDW